MSRYGDVHENDVTGERAAVLRGDEDGAGRAALVHLTVRPDGAVVGEHVHPWVRERFRVVAGTPATRIDGVERTLSVGEKATVPAGVAHDWSGQEFADAAAEPS